MTTSHALVAQTATSVMVRLSSIQRHPRLSDHLGSARRFPDLASGSQSWLMVCLMRPPIVVRAPEDGQLYAVANLRTLEWLMHVRELRGVSDLHIGALLVPAIADDDVGAWALAEHALMPVLLGSLSTREQRAALKRIKEAGIAGLTVSPVPRRRRLKPLHHG